MSQDLRTVFLEVEPWESEFIQSHCRQCGSFRSFRQELADLPVEEIRDVEILSIFIYSQLSREMIGKLEKLKMIATRSTGYDHIDLDACRERGIVVSNVPEYGSNTVAEHTFALILALTRKIHKAAGQTVRGNFSQEGLRGIDLKGRTIGVVGTGAIGEHVCRIARGFAMRVVAYDIRPNKTLANQLDVQYTDLDDLMSQSDIVTLHSPHLPETHHMISAERLALMKPHALLINTARGGLIDTRALLAVLREKKIGGAGLDVLEGEELIKEEREILSDRYDMEALQTLVQNNALLRMENVVITPHMAFNSEEALTRILTVTIDNISGFACGKPQNVVTPRE